MSTSLRVDSFDKRGQAVSTDLVVSARSKCQQISDDGKKRYSALVAEPTTNRRRSQNSRRRQSRLTLIENTPGMNIEEESIDDEELSKATVEKEWQTKRPKGSPPPQYIATPQVQHIIQHRPSQNRNHRFTSSTENGSLPDVQDDIERNIPLNSDRNSSVIDNRKYIHADLPASKTTFIEDDSDGDGGGNLRQVPAAIQPKPIQSVSDQMVQTFENIRKMISISTIRTDQMTLQQGAHIHTDTNTFEDRVNVSPQELATLRQSLIILEQQMIFDRLELQKKYATSLQEQEDRYGAEIAMLRAEMTRSKKIHKLVRVYLLIYLVCLSILQVVIIFI